MTDQVDLFGDPVPANFGGRGRPAHIPTRANRDKVGMLLAFGWNNERVANALVISVPTLRKCYRTELRARFLMRDRLDARVFEKLMAGVNEGNVGAIREFRKALEANDRMTSQERFTDRAAAQADKSTAKKGKKILRQEAAEATASQGRFAVPSAPGRMQ